MLVIEQVVEGAPNTLVMEFETDRKRVKIPTTFVPLAPERISFDPSGVDLLFGIFHIMWQDMPGPRSYGLKLTDNLSSDGKYLGCDLVCTFPEERRIPCTSV